MRFPNFLIRPARRRQWWTLFSVATALPALVLAFVALRAVRLVHLEVQQRASQEHDRAARAADEFLDRELVSGQPIQGAIRFAVRPDVVLLPADRLYFADPGDPPAEARRELAESTLELVEVARSAPLETASAMFARIASREPALRDWADFSAAVLRKDQKRIESRHWSESDGLTPTGLPVALLAAETSSDAALVRLTLYRLRAGAWWLSYEERLFHDAELSRALSARGSRVDPESRLAELADLGPVLVRAAPRLLAGDSRMYASGGGKAYLLVAHDGFRALVYADGECRMVSRNGHTFKQFGSLCFALGASISVPCVLDGEIVCLDDNGCPRFNDLFAGRAEPRFVAFDILNPERRDLCALPLVEHKRLLASIVPQQPWVE